MSTVSHQYWKSAWTAIQTVIKGLILTGNHVLLSRNSKTNTDISSPGYFAGQTGIATIQFPHETIPVPDTGRYQLHNEIEDCIVCDKCVKVCPVNCITIDPIRSPEEFGKTSDGTPKRIYAARFDIDMGKCCFCGLCTTVCPTECLTMTKTYDFSVTDILKHNFAFANMSPQEIADKSLAWEKYQSTKAPEPAIAPAGEPAHPLPARPVFKPRVKPPEKSTEE